MESDCRIDRFSEYATEQVARVSIYAPFQVLVYIYLLQTVILLELSIFQARNSVEELKVLLNRGLTSFQYKEHH